MKIYCDFHGVLTNGKISITADGTTLFEQVHTRDIRAIRQLVAMGYEFYILTASSSEIIKAFAHKTGSGLIVSRNKHTMTDEQDYIAVGDDSWDIEMLRNAALAYCPSDAIDEVKKVAQSLKTKGGEGCIDELLHILLK